MNNRLVNWFIIILTCVLAVGCTSVPTVRVARPWIRALKSTDTIAVGSKLKIEVSGNTLPLLGGEDLTIQGIRDKITFLLRRRGYVIENSSYDYAVQLSYKTERADKLQLSSTVSSASRVNMAFATNSVAGATSGLGVSIARAVGAITNQSSIVSEQSAEQMLSYSHTISIEIRNRTGKLVWKGESTWDSENLDLLSRLLPALQLILSDLPSDKKFRPDVPEVKGSHTENYYRLEVLDTWFTCPALPFRIWFKEPEPGTNSKPYIPSSVHTANALGAYLDLLQTAEYALPSGDDDDWKNPIRISLWEKVMIGGQYLLGPHRQPINVLIKLSSRSAGYIVDGCWVATDEQYAQFQEKLSRWQNALTDYFDVFVQ